ncbi:hypothetical protein Ctob_001718 [Chrysochromulina tobinii]|uniref:Uncharacterized protein n=1 Tax=Chrysochromulina tobinii TaxID=1460289 RepID=A0A0M0J5F0_9EUKA|nr:hypothetical protein Ctob_001718 [Chrysochromulina tobinii]|eukprot:KOO21710.1 hypothetical protein Ctob_001718 [Chrysochromulina sp. CCMP291]
MLRRSNCRSSSGMPLAASVFFMSRTRERAWSSLRFHTYEPECWLYGMYRFWIASRVSSLHTSMTDSCLVSMLNKRILRVFAVSNPICSVLSFHHGLPMSDDHIAVGSDGGQCRNSPIGQNGTSSSVFGSIYDLTFFVTGSNQCDMSVPAASMIGCTRLPGLAATSFVRSHTLPNIDTHKSSMRLCALISSGV